MTRTHCLAAALLLACSPAVRGQVRHEIHFPDPPGYLTLKCDLHMHTVFSDGTVWPTVRVDEAWRLGLDAIALSDHIEYLPHRDDVSTQLNRPFELAAERAREHDLLLARAGEITRNTPPGHFNAVLLRDVEQLNKPDFLEAVESANQQGGFVFWNHQEWHGAEKGRWLDIHTQMFENKWLHGMEVANGAAYYPLAHQWCLDKGLTMVGNSDIHEPDLARETQSNAHRTLTLVFVRERTLDGLREALLAGRTAVWFGDKIIGLSEHLKPLLSASIQVAPPHLRTDGAVFVRVRNLCQMDLRLQRVGSLGPAELHLPALATTLFAD